MRTEIKKIPAEYVELFYEYGKQNSNFTFIRYMKYKTHRLQL